MPFTLMLLGSCCGGYTFRHWELFFCLLPLHLYIYFAITYDTSWVPSKFKFAIQSLFSYLHFFLIVKIILIYSYNRPTPYRFQNLNWVRYASKSWCCLNKVAPNCLLYYEKTTHCFFSNFFILVLYMHNGSVGYLMLSNCL